MTGHPALRADARSRISAARSLEAGRRPASPRSLGRRTLGRPFGQVRVRVHVRVHVVGEAHGIVLGDEQDVLVELLVEVALFLLGARGRREIGRPLLRTDLDLLVLFGLIDLDVLLHALDECILQVVEGDRLVGDLAEGHDGVFVVVALEGDLGAGGDVARTLRRQEHELETIRYLEDAIFNGYTSHADTFSRWD